MRMRLLLGTSVLGLSLLLGAPAPAFAEPSADDRAVARSLFEQGRQMMKDGNYAGALPKLEESQRLDAGVGTLFNLADCYEHLGRITSAWGAFGEAGDLAKRNGQEDRAAVARERAAALAPKLPRVHLHLATPWPPMLELRIDDKPLSTAILDTDMPIDPGEHHIKASAPGKLPNDITLKIEPMAAVSPVEIPMLQDAPVAPVVPIGPTNPGADTPPVEPKSSWQKPAAIATGVGAIIGLGVGTIFGLKASSNWSDAEKACPDKKCTPDGYQKWDDARSGATISTVGFIAGGVLAAAAIVLWVTAPSEQTAPLPPVNSARLGQAGFWRMP